MLTRDDIPQHPWLATMERAVQAFVDRFGYAPEFTAPAPGRINLIGEHTDYNGGLVLPMTINECCVAVGSPAKGRASRLLAADLREQFEFDPTGDLSRYVGQPKGIARGHWASYILGVLDGFRQRGYKIPPLDIAIASDIPIGAGLSSSAALEASTAVLVQSILGIDIEPIDLAHLCREAEHTFAGVPCGIMDQLAVLLGEPGFALLIDCASERTTQVSLPPLEKAAILIIDTQVRHKLADGEYARRRATCAAAAAKLGVRLLCEAEEGHRFSTATLTEEESRCAKHVLGENWRVRTAVEALRSGDLPALGRLMFQSHDSLRDNYRVSCAELDTVVGTARRLEGVYGARMTGAGFGGCAIAILDPGALDKTTQRITAAFQQAHGKPCRVLRAYPPR